MSIFHILFGAKSNRKDNDNSVQIANTASDKNMNQNMRSTLQPRKLHEADLEAKDITVKLNIAAQLMRVGEFELSIDAYKNIAKHYPSKAKDCESQIGAALYFLGRYDEAMVHYNKTVVYDVKHDDVKTDVKEL